MHLKKAPVLLVFILFNFSSCQIIDKKHQRREMIKEYMQYYNDSNINEMQKHLHKEVVLEQYINEKLQYSIKGTDLIQYDMKARREKFFSMQQKPEVWAFVNQEVKVNCSYQAILANDLPGGFTKGDTLHFNGYSIFRFADDKISFIRNVHEGLPSLSLNF